MDTAPQTDPATAVVFYSRTGHSERIARYLSAELNATLLQIHAPSYAAPWIGALRAGWHSLRNRDMPDGPALPVVETFNGVVICGPVWTSYPAVPLRTFLRRTQAMPATVGLLLTQASQTPAHKAYEAARADLGREFAALQVLSNANANTDDEARHIREFIADLNHKTPWLPDTNAPTAHGTRLQ